MAHLYLGLVFHNHQPVGNYGFVLDEAFHRAYLPLLAALERHPGVRASLHYSGPLLDWLFQHQPAYVERLAALAARGQVELLTGGYYEPILPMIPEADRIGQIGRMNHVLRQRFGVEPSGAWLAERVWEPDLPATFARLGVRWTVLDDSHFAAAGAGPEELRGALLTEHEGHPLRLYAALQPLRYLIPWRPVEEVMDYLRSQADGEPGTIVVFADDGEKFGAWPGTHRHVWEEGWMERFLTAVESARAWLTPVPLGQHAASFPARGPVYVPAASYPEMLEWALPADLQAELARIRGELAAQGRDDVLRHLGGGFWRNFLRRYPEANTMHKRMLRTHQKVQRARRLGDVRGAQHALWRGQCNCPYWHGVFGGLYLRHIRAETHRNLVAAEREADRILHGGYPWLAVAAADFDFDGQEEVLVQSHEISLLLHPALGGALSEWDVRALDWSVLHTLARRPEAYHTSPEDAPDTHRRLAWQDRILPPGADLETLVRTDRDGGDFLSGRYQTMLPEEVGETATVRLRRDGTVDTGDGPQPLRVEKALSLSRNGRALALEHTVTNTGDRPVRAWFATEWNVNPPQAPGGDDRTREAAVNGGPFRPLDGALDVSEVRELAVRGSAPAALVAAFDPPVRLWSFPVETASRSEGGLERVYQGTCLLFLTPLDLPPGAAASLRLTWDVRAR
ncbi:MAG TPA: alpha-amylase/4-alpha-glucanotransferase domain-containing protein [Dehalococcoidia bacterium]